MNCCSFALVRGIVPGASIRGSPPAARSARCVLARPPSRGDRVSINLDIPRVPSNLGACDSLVQQRLPCGYDETPHRQASDWPLDLCSPHPANVLGRVKSGGLTARKAPDRVQDLDAESARERNTKTVHRWTPVPATNSEQWMPFFAWVVDCHGPCMPTCAGGQFRGALTAQAQVHTRMLGVSLNHVNLIVEPRRDKVYQTEIM